MTRSIGYVDDVVFYAFNGLWVTVFSPQKKEKKTSVSSLITIM